MAFLTERQLQILDFIRECVKARGISPTHREICDHFGYSSYGTVHKHLRLLREKGFLKRTWNQKRGHELVRPISDADADARRQRFEPSAGLPFLGRIAAGQPLETLSGDERIEVPEHLLGGRDQAHYVLEVIGNSMVDEGIREGDLVVVSQRQEARRGEMVVALVDGETTLKRFYPEGRRVRLQPSNADMEPIYVAADRLRIQGIVVGLMRKF